MSFNKIVIWTGKRQDPEVLHNIPREARLDAATEITPKILAMQRMIVFPHFGITPITP